MKYRNRFLLSAAVAFTLVSFPASAQTGQDEGDIIVTARKREESILRVPVVETVITQANLEKYQVQDLYAVATRVPGFVMSESVGTVGIQASLRGIGPTSQTATVDQSVSLNIDGMPLTQGHAFAASMFDVGQIEVLKGPQALFYGKSSTAGVIAIRSADPGKDFELSARAGYEFVADEKLGELIVSGPVNDWLGLRLAARYSKSEGFFRNTATPDLSRGAVAPHQRRFAPRETIIVRGTALFEPGDRYSARLKLNFVDDHTEGSGGDGQVSKCPDGRAGVAPLNYAFLADNDCRIDRNVQLGDLNPAAWPGIRNGGVPFSDSRQYFGTLEQNLKLDDSLTLTSVSGYYNIRQDNMIRGVGVSTPTIVGDFRFRNEQFTQEVRLTSDYRDSPVNFTLGGFLQDGRIDVDGKLRGNTAFGLAPLLQSHRHIIDIWSTSAFGQLIWKIADRVELSGGARWTRETRKHTAYNDLAGGAKVDLLTPRIRSSNVSPDVALTFTPTDDLTLFAAYRQGFKSGSFNTVVVASPTVRADFGDEKAEGGEIGLKTRLFDRQLSINLAAYHYIYSDLQVGANEIGPSGETNLRTLNAASAKVQGVELDFSYRPTAIEGLSVSGAVNYNRARYKNFTNAPCANGQTEAEGCDQFRSALTGRFTSQDLSGRPLVRAPEWSGNLALDYEMPVSSSLTLAMGTTATYTSKFYTNLVDLPDYIQNEYVKIGANLTLKSSDGGWEFALIGNNLTNQLTSGSCSNGNSANGTVFGGLISGGPAKGPAGSDEPYCVVERGREVWARVTFRL